ncbi:transcriptional regulator NrdR [Geochorda subterranea]|uniref:Transcriptional repressor NrdR n=1 Tax=Geochorda subterranea TaxID=3109564 RepID=A0ABZ1BTR4_9FIRM|nr:transcriptional regulator NrdR [Limnochorda sp. LNt]WRP15845.1 transcriptional regulator NrdR [Limnochorda sp. LNt]
MRCPFCSEPDTRVIDSRLTEEGAAVRRRRECPRCGRRFTTYERVEEIPLMVVKKDGRREPFSRQKVLAGVMKACEKRPIPVARIEELVSRVEEAVRTQGEYEVPSRLIGERVMEELRQLDPVAYVRFASVYRDFQDVTGFVAEVRQFLDRAGQGPAPAADAE